MTDGVMKMLLGEAWALRYYALFSALTVALGLAGSSLYQEYRQHEVVNEFFKSLQTQQELRLEQLDQVPSGTLTNQNSGLKPVVFDTSDIDSRVLLI